MSRTPEDFFGRYSITQGSRKNPDGGNDLLTIGNLVFVGSDPGHPDRVLVEFTTADGKALWPRSDRGSTSRTAEGAVFSFESGNLRCSFEYQGEPTLFQISLFTGLEPGYRALYGLMEYGDPEGVGVFGADEDPDGPTS